MNFKKIVKVAIIGALFKIQGSYESVLGYDLHTILIGMLAITLVLRWVK